MSIGHSDTDNLMRDNDIARSGKEGVLFRDDSRGQDFWANRNVLENNRIIDSGEEDGIAIDIRGNTKDTLLAGNTIRETRGSAKRRGIRIAAAVERLKLLDNAIEGFDVPIVDERNA